MTLNAQKLKHDKEKQLYLISQHLKVIQVKKLQVVPFHIYIHGTRSVLRNAFDGIPCNNLEFANRLHKNHECAERNHQRKPTDSDASVPKANGNTIYTDSKKENEVYNA